jgi:hypothetical protein
MARNLKMKQNKKFNPLDDSSAWYYKQYFIDFSLPDYGLKR